MNKELLIILQALVIYDIIKLIISLIIFLMNPGSIIIGGNKDE